MKRFWTVITTITMEMLIVFGSIVLISEYRYNAMPMNKPFSVAIQYLLPQHALSRFSGWLADSKQPWLKNRLISYFIHRYEVNMHEAIVENPYDYASFNHFFTRHLKPETRPIAPGTHQLASPVDGFVSQIGSIQQDTLLQAKGHTFHLASLLGSQMSAKLFYNGVFATFYLSPKDYHRVHMPYAGKLRETIFIPGKLFSVDPKTTATVPHLFARNERLICLFATDIGPMAVIFVGAMLVGSIETVWHAQTQANKIMMQSYDGSLQFKKGEEIGHFKMGSTVIILFPKDKMKWSPSLKENTAVRMGEWIGNI